MPESLDPEALFRNLSDRQVEYVLIGGLAAVFHGSALSAVEAEICVDPQSELALSSHQDARSGTVKSMPGGTITARTHPAPSVTYSDLAARAVSIQLYGRVVLIASLADLIVIAETSERLQDRAALPHLYALEDELAAIEREENG